MANFPAGWHLGISCIKDLDAWKLRTYCLGILLGVIHLEQSDTLLGWTNTRGHILDGFHNRLLILLNGILLFTCILFSPTTGSCLSKRSIRYVYTMWGGSQFNQPFPNLDLRRLDGESCSTLRDDRCLGCSVREESE